MRPDAVGEILAEHRIIGGREPTRERNSRVFTLDIRGIAAQELCRHRPPVEKMLGRRSVGVVVDVELASLRGDLALHSGEEADEGIIIVLGPAIEWMIVALCALDA